MQRILIIFFFSLFSVSAFSQIKIYTTSGNVIECQSVVKKRFGYEYLKVSSSDGYKDYISNTKIDRIEYENGEIEYVSGTAQKIRKRKDPKDFTYLSPHYASLNIGPSIPYALIAGDNDPYSLAGFNANIDVSFLPFKETPLSFLGSINLGAVAGYMYNPFNGFQHQSTVATQIFADTSASISNLNVQVGGWNNFYLLGSVGYSNGFDRWMLDYGLYVGGLFSQYPRADASYIKDGVTTTSVFSSHAEGLMGGCYGNIRYFLTRKLSLKGNIAFIYGTSRFEELRRREYQNGQLISETFSKPFTTGFICSINVTVGVAYTIGR